MAHITKESLTNYLILMGLELYITHKLKYAIQVTGKITYLTVSAIFLTKYHKKHLKNLSQFQILNYQRFKTKIPTYKIKICS
jgi:hypothetical protein